MKPIPVILDTDIGDDIDDAYALSLILRSPELKLLGVTTVFGNSIARARQAQTVLSLAGRDDIPVAAGNGAVLSTYQAAWPKPNRHEGKPFSQPAYHLVADIRPSQDKTCLPADKLPALDKRHGVDFLIETIMAGDGDIIPIAIGAFTNIAMAIIKEPRLIMKLPRIVVMGGTFDRLYAEWNIRCDPAAAAIVAESGIPMVWTGLDVTTKCVFNDADLERLNTAASPIARNLSAATKAWGGKYPTLHDPLAVETIFKPDIVSVKRGTVTVSQNRDATNAFTTFKEDANGQHEICVSVQAREAIAIWLDRVLA
ncbi:MAG: nucleoside hydrolase [Spirochaetes bacterium]|nr:nucleoside hydrolase [Spirochaetota bacterium]